MNRSSHPRVLGVLAGADTPSALLRSWCESADIVLAADGGADRLRAIGLIPTATIGDLDSITSQAANEQARLIRSDDQDTTDCDKLLSLAQAMGHSSITLACVEGDLLDHVIGTTHSAAKSSLDIRLALRRGIGYIVRGPSNREFETTAGSRLSTVPLTRCTGVTLMGVKWPLEDATMEPLGLTSLSNIAAGPCVRLTIGEGVAFVFSETTALPSWP